MKSPIKNMYIFHGRGDNPEGLPLSLENILKSKLPGVNFFRPEFPHKDPAVRMDVSYHYLRDHVLDFKPNSMVVGLDIGGLIAAKLQQWLPRNVNLRVMAVNSPSEGEGVKLSRLTYYQQLYALYSDKYTDIDWKDFTLYNSKVSWLEKDLKLVRYALSMMIWDAAENGFQHLDCWVNSPLNIVPGDNGHAVYL